MKRVVGLQDRRDLRPLGLVLKQPPELGRQDLGHAGAGEILADSLPQPADKLKIGINALCCNGHEGLPEPVIFLEA